MNGEFAAPCPQCGGIFEPPIVLPDGTRIEGHRPGAAGCTPRPPIRRHRLSPMPPAAIEPLTEAEREARADRIRARLAHERVTGRR